MNARPRSRREPVHGLDLVRFLAACLVAVYHLGFKAWALESSSLHAVLAETVRRPPGSAFTWCGWIGVQVFFVVSGAVIAYSASGASARGFAERRLVRLLPALLLAIAIVLPLAITVLRTAPGEATWLAIRTLAFAPQGPWIIGQFWTIPVELAFYALVCAVLGCGRDPTRILPWVLGAASAGYWAADAAGWIHAGGRLSELLLLAHGIYFSLGMLCARLAAARWRPGEAVLAAACLAAAALQVRAAARWEMTAMPERAAAWPLPYAVWLGGLALIALSFAYRDAMAAALARCSPGLRLAGLATYPFYLVHLHVGGAILLALAPLGPAVASLAAVGGAILVALTLAQWLEPPVRRALLSAIARLGRAGPRLRPG
ncbi:acyltransferase family protein [Novosphingobium soli]|uniref:Acyltransferase family protein n=1 Tax=Novosphingobium soli TaxID=574956 RepID=A0ABV6CY03_9SPHN